MDLTKRQDETLALLERLVACDSSNPGVGEAEVGRLVAELARRRGFDVRVVEAVPGRPNVIVDVVAGPGPALAFNGHLDTKAVGDARAHWRTDPWRLTVVDGRAYGVGTSDMKGGLAAMLVAAEHWAADATRGRVQLVFSADEETGGEAGAALLAAHGEVDAEAMVVAEPCGMERSWEALYLVSRGVTCFEVTVRARQGHSGLSDRYGPSATVAAARLIDALSRLRPSHPENPDFPMRPTVNAAVRMEGGVYYGVHPGLATFASDVRLLPGMTPELLEAEVRAALDAALPAGVTYDFAFAEGPRGWCAAAGIDPGHRLVACAQGAARDVLGHELPLEAYPGGTDASHFAVAGGVPCIAALGPGLLSVAHGADEHVSVEDLGLAAALFERIMRSFCDGGDGGDPGAGAT